MEQIIQMTFLGIVAGAFSCFWTRIIKKNMIFRKFGKKLETLNNRHIMQHNCDSMCIKFIQCVFCLCPWVVFLLSLFYIIIYTPWWLFAFIGVLGAWGSGNLVCEVTHALRNEG